MFSLTPVIFGCVCFVHLHKVDPISPQSVKCVFLGYSRTQKGYRCYDPVSWKLDVSADVTFFEEIPYYRKKGEEPTEPSHEVPLPMPTEPPQPTEPPIPRTTQPNPGPFLYHPEIPDTDTFPKHF
jgi:hypothetical protein